MASKIDGKQENVTLEKSEGKKKFRKEATVNYVK